MINSLVIICVLSFLTVHTVIAKSTSESTTTDSLASVTQGKPNLDCPQFQVFGYPETSDRKVLRRAFYTCRIGYAGLYDPAERTPLWVAERLTKSNLTGTSAEREQLDFIPDPDIPPGALPKPGHYAKSGYDKGHMAPAADFKLSQAAMNATFQFANAVPQTPESNRKIWKQLEDITRGLARRRGEIYVVTGPVYLRISRLKLRHSVSIPDSIFKILIDPKNKSMTAFIVPNNSSPGKDLRIYQVKVREVEKLTGLNFNPTLSRAEADRMEAVNGGDWVLPTKVKK